MRKRSGIFDGKTVLPVTAASFAMVFLIMSMLLTSFQAVIYGDPNYRFYEKEYEKYKVTEPLAMELEDVMEVTGYMMDYLIGRASCRERV